MPCHHVMYSCHVILTSCHFTIWCHFVSLCRVIMPCHHGRSYHVIMSCKTASFFVSFLLATASRSLILSFSCAIHLFDWFSFPSNWLFTLDFMLIYSDGHRGESSKVLFTHFVFGPLGGGSVQIYLPSSLLISSGMIFTVYWFIPTYVCAFFTFSSSFLSHHSFCWRGLIYFS